MNIADYFSSVERSLRQQPSITSIEIIEILASGERQPVQAELYTINYKKTPAISCRGFFVYHIQPSDWTNLELLCTKSGFCTRQQAVNQNQTIENNGRHHRLPC